MADASAERLRAGLLGGETFGIGRDHHLVVGGALGGLGLFLRREHPVEKARAMALDHLPDPANVDQVGADADDHADASSAARPRSIAARIRRTLLPSPMNSASPMMWKPMLSSAICGNAAICSAVA